MSVKPTIGPAWGTDPAANLVEPGAGQRALGFGVGQRPLDGHLNTLLREASLVGQYVLDGVFQGSFALSSTVSVTHTALATLNDYNPTGLASATCLRLVLTTGVDLHLAGLVGGADGRLLVVTNASTVVGDTVIVDHESGTSAAANRILLPASISGTGLVLGGGASAVLRYDGASARWRVISVAQ